MLLILWGPGAAVVDEGEAVEGSDEAAIFDEADSAAGQAVDYGLGEVEIGVHACGGIEEPDAGELCGLIGVFLLAGIVVREAEGVDLIQHLLVAVGVALRDLPFIGFAVDCDPGQLGPFRIGPAVSGIGDVIVLVFRWTGLGLVHDGGGFVAEHFVGIAQQICEGFLWAGAVG